MRYICQALPGGLLLRTDLRLSDTITGFYTNNSGSATNNLDWFESAIARPALVLIDLTSVGRCMLTV